MSKIGHRKRFLAALQSLPSEDVQPKYKPVRRLCVCACVIACVRACVNMQVCVCGPITYICT